MPGIYAGKAVEERSNLFGCISFVSHFDFYEQVEVSLQGSYDSRNQCIGDREGWLRMNFERACDEMLNWNCCFRHCSHSDILIGRKSLTV